MTTSRAFQDEALELLERNAAARERLRLRALIDRIPAHGWEARRFKSLALAAFWPATTSERAAGPAQEPGPDRGVSPHVARPADSPAALSTAAAAFNDAERRAVG